MDWRGPKGLATSCAAQGWVGWISGILTAFAASPNHEEDGATHQKSDEQSGDAAAQGSGKAFPGRQRARQSTEDDPQHDERRLEQVIPPTQVTRGATCWGRLAQRSNKFMGFLIERSEFVPAAFQSLFGDFPRAYARGAHD